MEHEQVITASEIGEFVYCKRGWWLRFTGVTTEITEAMIEGTKRHEELATRLENYDQRIKIAWFIIFFGVILLFVVVLAFIFIK